MGEVYKVVTSLDLDLDLDKKLARDIDELHNETFNTNFFLT